MNQFDPIISGTIGVAIVPPDEWVEAHKDEITAGRIPPHPPREECNITFMLVGQMVFPSPLTDPAHYRGATVPIVPLATMPYAQFVSMINGALAQQAAAERAKLL